MPDVHYAPVPDVVFTQLDDGEAVLLSLKTKRYYTLNETGTQIWDLFKKDRSPDEIASALMETYDVDQEAAREHITAFLEDLHREGLVQEISRSNSTPSR
ncbi:MAG: PqqD family peptide modification chaperone [Rhodothermales bacterium]